MKIGLAPQCSIVFTDERNVIGGTAIKSPFFHLRIFPIVKRAEEPVFTTEQSLAFNFFLKYFQNF